jgi:parallel beta-helix repeat protein
VKTRSLLFSFILGLGLTLLLAWLLISARIPAVQAAPTGSTIYVDADATGADTGLSWTDAFTTLQAALDAAAYGDEIWVAEGVYTPTHRTDAGDSRSATFVLTDGVALYGGFAATETLRTQRDWEANVTVLSGDLDGNDVTDANGVVTDTDNINGSNAYHVVTGSGVTETAVLDGFVVTGGFAGSSSYPHNSGGGMLIFDGSPTLVNVTFRGNRSRTYGGGLYLNNSDAMLTGITFVSNTAFSCGGGLYLYESDATLNGNAIVSNTSSFGGGLFLSYSDAMLYDNTISANIATRSGGGFFINSSVPVLSANTIASNAATNSGGGVYSQFSAVTLIGNTLVSNTASNGGGALIYKGTVTFTANTVVSNTANQGGGLHMAPNTGTLINNVLADNRANDAGGGLFARGSTLRLLHTTIARNSSSDGSGVYIRDDSGVYSSVGLTNTILVSHSVGISVTGGNTVTVNGVLWDSSTPVTVSQSTTAVVTVQNQHTGDPAFAADGYHVTPASDAIDAGVDAGVISDMDGEARPFDAGADLGADEWATAETTVEPASAATLSATVGGLTTTVEVPSQAVTEAVTLKYTALAATGHGSPAGFVFAGHAFDLDAYQGETLLAGFVFSKPVTITIHYDEGNIGGVNEDTLVLEYWDEGTSGWVDAVATCIPASVYDRHPDEDWLAVPICHLSRFAMFGERRKVYLPLVLRDY